MDFLRVLQFLITSQKHAPRCWTCVCVIHELDCNPGCIPASWPVFPRSNTTRRGLSTYWKGVGESESMTTQRVVVPPHSSRFDPEFWITVCAEFCMFSSWAFFGFISFLPPPKNHGRCEWVWMCVYAWCPVMDWYPIQVCSCLTTNIPRVRLLINCNPDQDKVLAEDECMKESV